MAAYSVLITPVGVQVLGDSGTLSTLALPTGITMMPGTRARTAVMNNTIIIAGATSAPVWLSGDLVLRALVMPTPGNAPTLAVGSAGTYTGSRLARVSYVCKALTGVDLAEGPLGPISNSVTVALEYINFSNLPIPSAIAPVTTRRVYLTTDGGATFFSAFDVDDITSTTAIDGTPDAALSLTAADPDLVAAPVDLNLLCTWKNRVWGRSAIDNVVGTAAGRTDRWPNVFAVDPRGTDLLGVTGFLPRRDQLGIGRRHVLWTLTGDDESTFAMVKVAEGKGILAPDSCLVIRDIGYFLSDDGVYSWGPDGITCLTDANVRPWFTTDTYFNRGTFGGAFAGYDPVRHRYLVFLSAVGSQVYDRWIELDIATGKWFGPNLSAQVISWFSAAIAPDGNDVLRLILSADDSFLYAFTPGSSTDGASAAIDFDIKGKFHSGDDPDLTHVWLEPTVFTNAEASGTLTVTPSVGGLTASAGAALSHDLTKDRERLPRPGVGRLCQFEFRQNVAGKPVSLYGYELPYVTLGRR